MVSWTTKKQFTFFAFFLLIIAVIFIFIVIKVTAPTCSDGRQNQGEEKIDCGGPCTPCLGEIKDLIILWGKPVKLKDGQYDAAALISNPNIFLGAKVFKYNFKLYDSNNILVAIREGSSYINPGEKFLIFENNIDTGNRIPARAFIEIDNNLKWERVEKEKPQLVISGKQFFNEPFPRLVVDVDNKSIFSVENVEAKAVLYDEDKNAKAISSTKVDFISGGSKKQIVFTWPEPFSEEPASSDVFLRENLVYDEI